MLAGCPSIPDRNCLCQKFPQFGLRHFLQRRAWHVIDETYFARHLEVGQRAFARRQNVILKRRRRAADAPVAE